MKVDLHEMLERIAQFFHAMSDNEEERLFYVLPINQRLPYAYQHSSIRDVATLCDILDLVQLFKKQNLKLDSLRQGLFERVTKNTLDAYLVLYENDALPNIPEGNIGDLGFFLCALQKCHVTFPSLLPNNWQKIKERLTKQLMTRQNPDGSIAIFFDIRLKQYEKEVEAFYLPEALIGLMVASSIEAEETIKKAVLYLCLEANRKAHMAQEDAVFYANWQFQWLYTWIATKSLQRRKSLHAEAEHAEKLARLLQQLHFAKLPFDSGVATVEVACYLEGLVHADRVFSMLDVPKVSFEDEINRALQFLYDVQNRAYSTVLGGFVHSLHSHEARVDVAGHVFNALSRLIYTQ